MSTSGTVCNSDMIAHFLGPILKQERYSLCVSADEDQAQGKELTVCLVYVHTCTRSSVKGCQSPTWKPYLLGQKTCNINHINTNSVVTFYKPLTLM